MYVLVVVGRPLLTEITEYYQHQNPLLKWLPPRIEGVCYTQKGERYGSKANRNNLQWLQI